MVEEVTQSKGPFSVDTFNFLEQLDKEPATDSYLVRKEEYKKYVENQFKAFFYQVATELPDEITNWLDIEYPKFTDPSWHSSYKGAFYTKGSNSLDDANLYIYLDKEKLVFGFRTNNGSLHKDLFFKNLRIYPEAKEVIYKHGLDIYCYVYNTKKGQAQILANWLEKASTKNTISRTIFASNSLTKNNIFQYSSKQIISQIRNKFQEVFPLFLLATCNEPIPAIKKFLNPGSQLSFLSPSAPFEEPIEEPKQRQEYSLGECAEETGFEEKTLERWKRIIERKKQAILYGTPGTGKTYIARKLAEHLSSTDGFWELVQFHPAYTYEDFIQGIRPKAGTNGQLDYPLIPGRFLQFCKKSQSYEGSCVLIIDEINRANLAQVFGELMYLLEYRSEKIQLAGGNKPFCIPENVYLIGTMNTADRSISLVDHALRRRFAFLPLPPNYQILERHYKETDFPVQGLIKALKFVNQALDEDYKVGISFFLNLKGNFAEQIEDIWQMEIEPYLKEYFFNKKEQLDQFRWSAVRKLIFP
jgi:5-methylcytosine-specific restriction protein B